MSQLNSPARPYSSQEWQTRLKTINKALELYNGYADASQLISNMGLVIDGGREISNLRNTLEALNAEEEALIKENTDLATRLTRLMNRAKSQQ